MARDDNRDQRQGNEAETDSDLWDTVPDPVRSDRDKDNGPMGPIGADLGRPLDENELARRAEDIGLTGGAEPGQGPTDDDMAPETLIREDGARHQFEQGGSGPADRDLETVSADEIGAGGGLDEAEEARLDPLDGKPWDGDPDDPLTPEPGVNQEDSEVGQKVRKDRYGES